MSESPGGLLRGKRPGSGYNKPTRLLTKPKTYHFPVAFLDVFILQGFIQVEAGRKNNNNQVSEEPEVSHPLLKTRVLQEETWQDVEDQRETPGSQILGVSAIYRSIRRAGTSLRLNNGCPRRLISVWHRADGKPVHAMVEAPAPGCPYPKRTPALGEGAQSCPRQQPGPG